MFITNSPAPSRINSAELPQRDVTVWEFAIFGYSESLVSYGLFGPALSTTNINIVKWRYFVIFSPVFFCSLNWEFSYSNWEKNILFGIGNTTEYGSSKRAKKNPADCATRPGTRCCSPGRIRKCAEHTARFVTGNYNYESGRMTGTLGQIKCNSSRKGEKTTDSSYYT